MKIRHLTRSLRKQFRYAAAPCETPLVLFDGAVISFAAGTILSWPRRNAETISWREFFLAFRAIKTLCQTENSARARQVFCRNLRGAGWVHPHSPSNHSVIFSFHREPCLVTCESNGLHNHEVPLAPFSAAGFRRGLVYSQASETKEHRWILTGRAGGTLHQADSCWAFEASAGNDSFTISIETARQQLPRFVVTPVTTQPRLAFPNRLK
jgi:hypothetical protein